MSRANRNTVKTHLRKWVHPGQFQQHGAGCGVWRNAKADGAIGFHRSLSGDLHVEQYRLSGLLRQRGR